MIKRLLAILTIVLSLTIFSAPLNPTFAQTTNFTTTYFDLMQLLILQQARAQVILTRVQPTSKPTAVASSGPTATTKPTTTPTPTKVVNNPTQTPTKAPTSAPTVTNSSDPMNFIMDGINKYRASLGLAGVTTSAETCSFAAIRAQEITTGFNHDGFTSRSNNKTIPYAHWTKITENLAMTSDSTKVVDMWINSPEHAANIRMDTPYVCVRQNGNYFAYEGMKP